MKNRSYMNLKKIFSCLVLVFILVSGYFPLGATAAINYNPRDLDIGFNGAVYSVVSDGDKAYVGGSFTAVYTPVTRAGKFDASDGSLTPPSFPAFNNTVRVGIPDGSGGWYIGGEFTVVGGITRNRLVHIDSSGAVDPAFDPDMDAPVYALVLDGNTLYAGGEFANVNDGTTRRNLAAFDIDDGTVTAFNPIVWNTVRSLVLSGDGDTLYAGGDIICVNGDYGDESGCMGTERNGVAAFNTSDGVVTAFNPDVIGSVHAMVLDEDNSIMYVGGAYSTVNGVVVRNRLAAFDTSDGTASSFDPDMNNTVNTLALSDDGATLYVGGEFTDLNGSAASRFRIAGINTATGLATAFNPTIGNNVNSIFLDGTTLYAGGDFETVNNGSVDRNHIAAFNISNGSSTAFDPDLDANVYSVYLEDGDVFAGGAFLGSKPVDRNYIAVIDIDSGTLDSMDINANSQVKDLFLDGTTLYMGGTFSEVNGGTARNGLAAIDIATGLANSFDPNLDSGVEDIYLSGSTLYAAGNFTEVNGGDEARNGLAAFNTATGTVTAFDPDVDAQSYSIFYMDGVVYASGDFSSVNGSTPMSYMAAFDASTGTVTAFDAGLSGPVYTINGENGLIYVGGEFNTVNTDQARLYFAILDADTGVVTSFDGDLEGSEVDDILFTSTGAYIGGGIESVDGGSPRLGIANFSTSTGAFSGFNPGLDSYVFSLYQDDNYLFAGGNFLSAGTTTAHHFAMFSNPEEDSGDPDPTPVHHHRRRQQPVYSVSYVVPTSTDVVEVKPEDEKVELQHQIDILLEQIEALKQKLGLSPLSTFPRNLTVGDTGSDVKALQVYLNGHGYILTLTGPGSPGNETERFGAFTREALKRLQSDKGISPALGFFGPLTRAYVNSHP